MEKICKNTEYVLKKAMEIKFLDPKIRYLLSLYFYRIRLSVTSGHVRSSTVGFWWKFGRCRVPGNHAFIMFFSALSPLKLPII